MISYRCHYEPFNLATIPLMRSGALGKPYISHANTQARTPQIVEIDQFAREIDWMADVLRGRAPMVLPDEEGL